MDLHTSQSSISSSFALVRPDRTIRMSPPSRSVVCYLFRFFLCRSYSRACASAHVHTRTHIKNVGLCEKESKYWSLPRGTISVHACSCMLYINYLLAHTFGEHVPSVACVTCTRRGDHLLVWHYSIQSNKHTFRFDRYEWFIYNF